MSISSLKMRFIFTASLFILLSPLASAQSILSNSEWITKTESWFPQHYVFMDTIRIEGTVSINGKTYTRLTNGVLLREDLQERKVWKYEAGRDRLLYDFGLNLGDTVRLSNDISYTVVQLDRLNLQGLARKCLILQSISSCAITSETWIEGLGSFEGPIYHASHPCFPLPDQSQPQLMCAHINGALVYAAAGSSCAASLPVVLSDFEAQALSSESVQIRWETETEKNFSHFEVEWSIDGSQFQVLSELLGEGAENLSTSYTYIHQGILPQTNYYRLKQVDIDGAIAYSHIVQVRMDQLAQVAEAFPNPTAGVLNISLNRPASDLQSIRLLDVLGRNVTAAIDLTELTDYKLQTNLSALTSGRYILLLEFPEKLISLKISKR